MHVELVVGVAGPSGAGKSTIAAAAHAALGDTAIVLPYDAYYRDLSALPLGDRDARDFDCPDALEGELLIAHLSSLRNGNEIAVPSYDFNQHVRTGADRVVAPHRVVFVEGLFVLVDELVRSVLDFSVYVDAPEANRLERRIARDTAKRGRAVEGVRHAWRCGVRPAERAMIEPSRRWADLVVKNEGPLSQAVDAVVQAVADRLTSRRRYGETVDRRRAAVTDLSAHLEGAR